MITGTIVNYYFHCKTQMWLHYHKINLEDNSEDVRIGKVLHEISETKVDEVSFEGIKVDKITKDYVVEVKKSDSDIEAGKWQLLYYLYILKQKGVEKKGRLEVFEKNKQDKKRFVIELTEENEMKLLEILDDIEKILRSDTPLKPKFEGKCRKCAYYEYCFL
ncbi:CRISPR-associated protein Cas4 [Caminibacter pacificus]|uniref:CRISPR-associated exonuclease Cas4 n=1 Tax=Caminibacter pacificus TaxID=1424653 RepID=A0AAJ4REE4_9BACT|nr:CRISPR-associated protein Cas4 [Caminibacter pacificus]QCI28218.1 Dna2/Cas4 domain-containing protein [Caminibacter pacificus]ROR41069.1 CRISPR-associated exonuclease Cas4 [Caminibacter pacificus]